VDYGLMLEEGEGIPPRMIEEMEKSFLHLPELDLVSGDFQVRLKNTPICETGSPEWVSFFKRLPITERQRRVMIGRGQSGFTSNDYQKLNQVDRDTASREIQELVQKGIVELQRKTRGAKYYLSLSVSRTVDLVQRRFLKLREHVTSNESLSNADYRAMFNLSRNQAKQELKYHCEQGYLLLTGARRGAKYLKGTAF
jgi:predicted HTH transcriptional regulator